MLAEGRATEHSAGQLSKDVPVDFRIFDELHYGGPVESLSINMSRCPLT